MAQDPSRDIYAVDSVVTPQGQRRLVVLDRSDRLHVASGWLTHLYNQRKSPNTIGAYAPRVVAYLNWTAPVADWRAVSTAHLTMWANTIASTWSGPSKLGRTTRSEGTIHGWLAAVRSFYRWAAAEGLLAEGIGETLTSLQYRPPGSPGGGEYGRVRAVIAADISAPSRPLSDDPKWIDDEGSRLRLEALPLSTRNRLLVDLMYYLGIRAGEALSLFTEDFHLSGGSPERGCTYLEPHLHVRTDNPVENGARAKGAARVLDVPKHLIETYVDYVLERQHIAGPKDRSPHAIINLHARDNSFLEATRYKTVLDLAKRCGKQIDFPINGPHLFRHTFATRLRRGIDCDPVPLNVLQRILGHRSIESTGTYTHGLQEAERRAVLSLPTRKVSLQ